MDKNKRVNLILFISIAVLCVVCSILLVLNQNEVEKSLDKQGDYDVIITYNEEVIGGFTMDTLTSMEKVEINEGLRTSNGNEDAIFGGVLLKDLLEEVDIDISTYKNVSFKAIDGYTSASDVEEVLNTDKVYVVYERNGIPTKSKEEGGTGPIEIVIAGEEFSLRNCKFLIEIILGD